MIGFVTDKDSSCRFKAVDILSSLTIEGIFVEDEDELHIEATKPGQPNPTAFKGTFIKTDEPDDPPTVSIVSLHTMCTNFYILCVQTLSFIFMFLITLILISILSQTTDATTTTGATQTTPQTTTTNEATTNTTPQTTTASCQEPQLCDCAAAETIELGTVTQGSLNEDSPIFPKPRPGVDDRPACPISVRNSLFIKTDSPVAWFKVIGTGEEITASTCSETSNG